MFQAWLVKRPKGRAVRVTAQYFVIEAGNLIFRNAVAGRAYPVTVRVFAFKQWCEVEKVL
jgi:hypothetical protein